MRSSEIVAAVCKHNKLVNVIVYIIIRLILVIPPELVRICCLGNMRIMNLFYECGTYGALQHMIFPLTVHINRDIGITRTVNYAEKCAVTAIGVYRRRTQRIYIEAICHTAVRLCFKRFSPHSLNIFYKL